jgi:Ser/Thr protein kinase RdoA (MazF antagonist)
MVLERVAGPTMPEVLESDPGDLERQIRTLATLHDRLHAIAAPPGLAAIGGGATLLHLDLHPKNVILGRDGPYVVDWANARSGHWADDVAQTIALVWSALADPTFAARDAIVHQFVEAFVAHFDRDVVRAHIPAAVARRVADANVTDAEREVTRHAERSFT